MNAQFCLTIEMHWTPLCPFRLESAGDHVRSAADMGLDLTAVSLWYRQGYGLQSFDTEKRQVLSFPNIEPDLVLEDTGIQLNLTLGEDPVAVRVFRKEIQGIEGKVFVYFLDAGLEENDEKWRSCADKLYGGDAAHRLRQEMILGFGAMALAKELGIEKECRVHLNEGHCAMAAVSVFEAVGNLEDCKERCRFTTHTPVAAGHDVFDHDLVRSVTGEALYQRLFEILRLQALRSPTTRPSRCQHELARRLVEQTNGVSGSTAQSLDLFPEAVPEGVVRDQRVHLATWCVDRLGLLDEYLPGWRSDPELLEQADDIQMRHWLASCRQADSLSASCRLLGRFDPNLP